MCLEAATSSRSKEITGAFPDTGLEGEKPDFLFCLGGQPELVLETHDEASKIDSALTDAQRYAETITASRRYNVRMAVGVAGEEESGVLVRCSFREGGRWLPLRSHGCELTNIPSRREAELALQAADGSTSVSVPTQAEFIAAAVDISRILRSAKVEAPLRPRVIGAMVLALVEGEIDADPGRALRSINALAERAIRKARDLPRRKQDLLIEALGLSGAAFDRLASCVRRIAAILEALERALGRAYGRGLPGHVLRSVPPLRT